MFYNEVLRRIFRSPITTNLVTIELVSIIRITLDISNLDFCAMYISIVCPQFKLFWKTKYRNTILSFTFLISLDTKKIN